MTAPRPPTNAQPTAALAPPRPVAEIEREDDRLRCGPYNATITARGCLARQARLAPAGDHETTKRAWMNGGVPGDVRLCARCEDGRIVHLRVRGEASPLPVVADAAPLHAAPEKVARRGKAYVRPPTEHAAGRRPRGPVKPPRRHPEPMGELVPGQSGGGKRSAHARAVAAGAIALEPARLPAPPASPSTSATRELSPSSGDRDEPHREPKREEPGRPECARGVGARAVGDEEDHAAEPTRSCAWCGVGLGLLVVDGTSPQFCSAQCKSGERAKALRDGRRAEPRRASRMEVQREIAALRFLLAQIERNHDRTSAAMRETIARLEAALVTS